MKRCPLCERPWLGPAQLSPLHRRIAQYADGTRSYKELAKLTRSTPGSVAMALVHMRRAGFDVKGREKASKYAPERSDHEQMRLFRQDGLTWRQIGQRLGISESGAFRRAKLLEVLFGELPGRSHNKRKDPARDYIRIRELRVDAQLPWKRIGPVVGMNQAYVARYWAELCKVYGG